METLGPQMVELAAKTNCLGEQVALAVEDVGKDVLVEPAFRSSFDTSNLVNPSFLFRDQE